jgi:2'-5' RNA ligase
MPFRAKYDPSAAAGMPAHITVLYPFLPPDEIDAAAFDALGKAILQFATFDFSLTAVRQFDPGVLYLQPEPDEPFRQITRAVWACCPQTPPYRGQYGQIVPHLTVADVGEAQLRDRITAEFIKLADGKLPVRARTGEVALMEKRRARWQVSYQLSVVFASKLNGSRRHSMLTDQA